MRQQVSPAPAVTALWISTMVIWAVQGDQHGFWRVGLVVVPAAFACTYAVAIALRRLEFDLRWKRNPGHN